MKNYTIINLGLEMSCACIIQQIENKKEIILMVTAAANMAGINLKNI